MLRAIFIGCLALFLGMVFTNRAAADEFDIVPSIAVKEEYNDNIFLTAAGQTSDYITTLSPEIELEQRTARLNMSLTGRLVGLLYAENHALNHIDQDYSGRVHYQLTSRLQGGFDAGYLIDSRPDRDIESTGLVLGTDIRHRWRFRISGNYALTEKTHTAVSYAYNREKFDETPLSDFSSHTTDIGFTHNLETLWKSTQGRMNFGYTMVDYTTSRVDNYTVTLGLERRLSELYQFDFYIGPRFTRTTVDFPGVPANEVWGVRGNFGSSYRGEYVDVRISFLHDVQPASGRTGATERSGLSTSVGYRFTDKFRGDLSASYFINKSESQAFAFNDIEENTFRIQPRLRYDFTRDMTLEASYVYTIINNQVTDTQRSQNIVYLRFVFRYPLLGS